MRTKTARIDLRVTEEEKTSFQQIATRYDCTVAGLVRLLVQMPQRYGADPKTTALVLDAATTFRIAKELRHWGYQYNQAVHALNSLAYYARLGDLDAAGMRDGLAAARRQLDTVNRGVADLKGRMAHIAKAPVLFM